MVANGNVDGTMQRCACHGSQTLAMAYPDSGVFSIQDRRHGTTHRITYTLAGLVGLLDPTGTAFTPVQVGSTGHYV